MSHNNDPVSVTAYLRDLVQVFVEGSCTGDAKGHRRQEQEVLDRCFQLLLGRNASEEERKEITPWWNR